MVYKSPLILKVDLFQLFLSIRKSSYAEKASQTTLNLNSQLKHSGPKILIYLGKRKISFL